MVGHTILDGLRYALSDVTDETWPHTPLLVLNARKPKSTLRRTHAHKMTTMKQLSVGRKTPLQRKQQLAIAALVGLAARAVCPIP